MVSATNGTTLLWASGFVEAGGYGSRWMLWWFGDAMGVLVVGGLLFAVAALLREPRRPSLPRTVELVSLASLMVFSTMYVFGNETWRYPRLLFPLLVWATLRFRALGATLTIFILSVVAITYTVDGSVAMPGLSALRTVQLLQTVIAIVGIGMLVIAAALSERDASRARLEAALADEQEVATRLRTLDEMKDRLLTAVSHELRTPLTSILALSTILQDRHEATDAFKRQEMLDHLVRESHRLDMLLSDLLDLERLRRGILTPQLEMVDVPAVMRAALERYADAARPTLVELDDVQISADPAKLDRIVDNQIGNAYKHTPFDKAVSVTLRSVDGGALIAVDDEGTGVPDELKVAIFEPFHRGSADVTHVPGTGIGLSLVAHFTELHGGRAWVEDRDGGGSSFRVFLPGDKTLA
jgi:signal transduction histidine kinase